MITLDNTLHAIRCSLPYLNLIEANWDGEVIENSKADELYLNKVGHIQKGTDHVKLPLLISGQFKMDDEHTRTETRCIKSVVELREYLLYLYEFRIEILKRDNLDIITKDYHRQAKARALFDEGHECVAEVEFGDRSGFIPINPRECEVQILLNHVSKLPGHLFIMDAESALLWFDAYNEYYCKEKRVEFFLEIGELFKALNVKSTDDVFRKYVFSVEKYLGITVSD